MNSVKIFSSLFFAAACLFRVGYSDVPASTDANPVRVLYPKSNPGNVVAVSKDDDDFKSIIKDSDTQNYLAVFYFYENDDNFISTRLAQKHPTAHVIRVNTGVCKQTKEDFGFEKLPVIILRRNGRHLAMYISPPGNNLDNFWSDMDENIQKYVNMPPNKENELYQEITHYEDFKPALTAADLSNKLVFIFIGEEIHGYIEIALRDYKAEIKALKIGRAIRSEVEQEFAHRAQFVKDSSPKIFIRKFKKKIHRFFGWTSTGCGWTKSFDLIQKYRDMQEENFQIELFTDTMCTSYGYEINAVQYPEDYSQVLLLIAAADRAKKVVLLYIVRDEDFSQYDSSIDDVAKFFPTIMVIRVDAQKCTAVLTEYADKDRQETIIKKLPLFIVRAFKKTKTRYENYNYGELSYTIIRYRDAIKDPDLPENQPKTYRQRMTYNAYQYGERVRTALAGYWLR